VTERLTILQGDALEMLKTLPEQSAQCCVTSPPYWGLRDYGVKGQLGLEKTPEKYVSKLVEIFREVRRVLKDDGTAWINIGDSFASGKGTCYNPGGNTSSFNVHLKAANVHPLDRGSKSSLAKIGLKPKDLVGVPWMVAFALRSDGWWLRSDIIWAKANCMPESVTDRPTRSHEYLFLLTKSANYHYDYEAIKEPASEADWESRLGRANLNNKLFPTDKINGIRPRVKYTPNGKDKQAGHSRRHDGFNDRWDAMEKAKMSHGQDHRRGEDGTFSNNKADRPINGMRNKRDVWTVAPANFKESHFAVFPPELIKPCILAGCPVGGTVIDPFFGSGTTGMVSLEFGRNCIGIELNPEYIQIAKDRCNVTPGLPL